MRRTHTHTARNILPKVGIFAVIGMLMLGFLFISSPDSTHIPEPSYPPMLWGYSPPAEQCNDGLDNDEDTLTDCEDVDDCSFASNCMENCTNMIDDDGDFAVDCDDSWCENDPACME